MKTYGPRHLPTGEQALATPTAASVRVVTTLWQERLAGGVIYCELLDGGRASRTTRVIAEYREADGRHVQTVCHCETAEEEQRARARYAARIRRQQIQPAPDSDPSAP